MTTKSKAWSAEMTEKVISAYENAGKDNSVLTEIAKETGKTVPAIRSKLVAEKVYKRAEVAQKKTANTTRKIELVHAAETILSVPKDSFSSFENGSKAQLELLVKTLIQLGDKPQ